jgi:transposase
MERRRHGREFKLEAVRLVRERGATVAQARARSRPASEPAAQLVKAFEADPQFAFLGKGEMKPEQFEIERLRREVRKLKAERDILKKAAAYFGPVRRRRADQGALASGQARRAAAPLQPRQPIYERAVPAPAGRERYDLQREAVGQCMRQRGDGELLLLAED